jgi:probable rRNA maturation factor
MITFVVEREAEGWPEGIEDLAVRCGEAVEARALAEMRGGEGSVLLADDETVRALNRDWRGKDKPTNVLSFPAEPVPGFPDDEQPLGDLALAFQTCAAEAAEKRVALSDHAAHLLVHGILHLLGYDHRDGEEARRMEALETRALLWLGLPPPYEDDPAD